MEVVEEDIEGKGKRKGEGYISGGVKQSTMTKLGGVEGDSGGYRMEVGHVSWKGS